MPPLCSGVFVRYLISVAGIFVSLPIIVFFGIGSSTFIRADEKAFASLMLLLGVAVLALSLVSLFNPSAARLNLIAIAVAVFMCAAVGLIYAR